MKKLLSKIKVNIGWFSKKRKIEKYGLTNREKAVCELIIKKRSYKEISAELGIKQKTVSKHASNIFKKMECKNRDSLEKKFE